MDTNPDHFTPLMLRVRGNNTFIIYDRICKKGDKLQKMI